MGIPILPSVRLLLGHLCPWKIDLCILTKAQMCNTACDALSFSSFLYFASLLNECAVVVRVMLAPVTGKF